MVAMKLARLFPHLLLALMVWGLSVPLIAVTCVPSAPCAGLMAHCPLAGEPRPAQPTVAAPDCCEQTVRDGELPAMPGAKLPTLDLAPVATAVSLAPPPSAAWLRTPAESARPAAIPLYTLHSILLI
jgi:hypothetical protein